MREIFFRGKTINNYANSVGEWVYGNLIQERYIVGDIEDWEEDYFNTEWWAVVDPKTVGQYTGLKDKNGTEIYEGDIVKTTALLNDHHQRGATVVSQVEYWHGATCLSIAYVPLSLDFQMSHEIEIIGNIYENPELLKWF